MRKNRNSEREMNQMIINLSEYKKISAHSELLSQDLRKAIERAENEEQKREMRNIKRNIKSAIKAIENCLDFDIYL